MKIEPSDQINWGIIRYAGGSGRFPDEDAAGFDGWYSDRDDAMAVAKDWSLRYPQWIVALVRSDLVWFGNGDFTTVNDQTLTAREHMLHTGQWSEPR